MTKPGLAAILSVLGSMILLTSSSMTSAEDRSDDVQDLIYLARDRPVLIRLHIRVLNEGFRGLRAAYAKTLHQTLDTDGDGVLNAAEMNQIPATEQLLPPRSSNEKPRSFSGVPVDADADGSVSSTQLSEYVRVSSGSPFDFRMAPPLHAKHVDPYEVIDVNHDGTLDEHELHSAAHSLLKYDANSDEIIDQSEMSVSGRGQVERETSRGSSELLTRLLVVDTETDGAIESLIARVVHTYDRPAAADGSMVNADALSAGDVRRFILNGVPDVEIEVPLGSAQHAAIVRTNPVPNAVLPSDVVATLGARGNLQLTLGNEHFDLVLGACPTPAPELRRQYEAAFAASDRDGNEYLDTAEARPLEITAAHYSSVDRNGDGMIQKNELIRFAELESSLFGSRVVLLLTHERQSVFDLVDGNADSELRMRELHQAKTKLLSWDLNGDGRITHDERPAHSQLVIQNGETTFLRWKRDQKATNLTATTETAGPEWFRRMDRNGDGDVSAREFLGTRETYFRFDVNFDGMISAAEAENNE